MSEAKSFAEIIKLATAEDKPLSDGIGKYLFFEKKGKDRIRFLGKEVNFMMLFKKYKCFIVHPEKTLFFSKQIMIDCGHDSPLELDVSCEINIGDSVNDYLEGDNEKEDVNTSNEKENVIGLMDMLRGEENGAQFVDDKIVDTIESIYTSTVKAGGNGGLTKIQADEKIINALDDEFFFKVSKLKISFENKRFKDVCKEMDLSPKLKDNKNDMNVKCYGFLTPLNSEILSNQLRVACNYQTIVSDEIDAMIKQEIEKAFAGKMLSEIYGFDSELGMYKKENNFEGIRAGINTELKKIGCEMRELKIDFENDYIREYFFEPIKKELKPILINFYDYNGTIEVKYSFELKLNQQDRVDENFGFKYDKIYSEEVYDVITSCIQKKCLEMSIADMYTYDENRETFGWRRDGGGMADDVNNELKKYGCQVGALQLYANENFFKNLYKLKMEIDDGPCGLSVTGDIKIEYPMEKRDEHSGLNALNLFLNKSENGFEKIIVNDIENCVKNCAKNSTHNGKKDMAKEINDKLNGKLMVWDLKIDNFELMEFDNSAIQE
jgi:hypothetical protein